MTIILQLQVAVFMLSLLEPTILFAQSKHPTDSRRNREIVIAQKAVFASMAVSRSPKGRYRCTQDSLACVGPDKGELGLALLGNGESQYALEALASLSRYQLDGALQEDYQCYVLQKGPRIKQYLEIRNIGRLAEQCQAEFNELIEGSEKGAFAGLKADDVCRDPAQIKRNLDQLLKAINSRRKCSAEDF